MIRQTIKDKYYDLLYLASVLLRPVYALDYRLRKSHLKKVHAGCGNFYVPGFLNLDGNYQRKVDYVTDLRAGLPVPDNSLEFIYSCHMLEHVEINDAEMILKNWLAKLAPGGYVRLTLPDFNTVFKILSGEVQYQFPREFASPQGQAINYLFCDSQHKYGYCLENITEIAKAAGYSRVEPAADTDPNLPADLREPMCGFSVNLYK